MSRCSIQIECVSIKTSFDKAKCILVSSVTEVLWYRSKRSNLNILLYGVINRLLLLLFMYSKQCKYNVKVCLGNKLHYNGTKEYRETFHGGLLTQWYNQIVICNTNLAIPQPQVVNFVVEPLQPVVYLFTIVP